MYKKEFQITDNTSNNSFSFSERKNPTIIVPKIVDGEIDDAKIGNKIIFEDFDENKNLKSCIGLENFIRTTHPTTKKPIIIVDNHNHVLYFWYEARKNGLINNGSTLIHIDQHKDMRKPDLFLSKTDSNDLQKVFEYTNSALNVGNYIPPAVEEGLVEEVISITSESEMQNAKCEINNSIILNIDLDFWAPEMNYIDNKLKADITKKWMKKADLITIATSPFFIDQELAIKILHDLFVIQ